MVLGVLLLVLAFCWSASKENPQYRKSYFQSRSDGVFRTEYAPGFSEYLECLEKEVPARFTVGPFSPTDDLLSDLYHPELEDNWRRELFPQWRVWLQRCLRATSAVLISLSIAATTCDVISGRYAALIRLLQDGSPSMKILAWIFALAVYVYIRRSGRSIDCTQGYLDGYSDRCAGREHNFLVFGKPGNDS